MFFFKKNFKTKLNYLKITISKTILIIIANKSENKLTIFIIT